MSQQYWTNVDQSIIMTFIEMVGVNGGIASFMLGGDGNYYKIRLWLAGETIQRTADNPAAIGRKIARLCECMLADRPIPQRDDM